MTEWIALLRGVNVGGITVRSAELAALFRELGFDGVRTVLASGNVAFSTGGPGANNGAAVPPESGSELKSRIERALSDRFGYEAWIVLVTRDELERVIASFPFDADREGWHPYVVFSSSPDALDELVAAAGGLDAADDIVARGVGVLYWHNRRERGVDSAFSKVTAKARFKPSITTRNLRTLRKLTA
ncbi:DUF1697 domain-containing protein [Agromyces lapidis]|uniref:DUF1697 domain-containing protein n=1 Tax=Agromyces lapidis TaxID=279574 RepID=A0ABV5SQ05_9MICO|nr:DUF1697 domain-containing protein [Agromyces lapidis]